MRPELRRSVFWILAAVTLFASGDAAAKWLGQTYPLTAAVWVRYLVPSLLVGAYLVRRQGLRFAHTPQPVVQVQRGLSLVGSTLLFWQALASLPLVEAATVTFIGPTIVVILSAWMLREKPGRDHWVALVMGFIGVLIVLRPGLSNPGVGALAALGSALLYSYYLVLTRKVSGQVDSITLLFYANAVGAIVMTFIAPVHARLPANFGEGFALVFLSFCGLVGHWCIIRAYQRCDAVTLAPFTYSQLLLATFWGWVLYDTLPDGFTLIGMLVILGAGLYVLTEGGRAWKRQQINSVRATPE